jgi:drug/metabolite transporter (DMT)-like permease
LSKASAYWFVAILISALSAICFSTKAVIVKLAYRDAEVDTITLLALRMLFSLPFFIAAAVFSSQKQSNVRFTPRQWVHVGIIGLMGYYISSFLDFVGLRYVPAGIERLILFIYPTFVVLISAVWFKVPVSKRQMGALLLTYAGLLLAYISEARVQSIDSDFFFGSLCIFICAITFAIYIAGSGKLIPSIGSVKFNSYAMSFASLGVLTHFALTSNNSLLGLSSTVYGYSAFMAIISTVIPSYLVSISLNRLGANNTSIIASLGPISTILQASYFLDERISALQWLGTLLILVGILMISWKAGGATDSK